MAGFCQLAHLAHPANIFTGPCKASLFSQSHFHHLARGHHHGIFDKPLLRARRARMLMVRHACDMMLVPHLLKKCRAIPFSVKDQNEATEILHHGEMVGAIRVYYTETALTSQIRLNTLNAKEEVDE
jgi:hypothetical protein